MNKANHEINRPARRGGARRLWSGMARGTLRQTLLSCAVAGVAVGTVASFASLASAQTTTIPVTDPNWFLSPYNWNVSGSAYAEAARSGAYFKIGFPGTSIALQLGWVPEGHALHRLPGAGLLLRLTDKQE